MFRVFSRQWKSLRKSLKSFAAISPLRAARLLFDTNYNRKKGDRYENSFLRRHGWTLFGICSQSDILRSKFPLYSLISQEWCIALFLKWEMDNLKLTNVSLTNTKGQTATKQSRDSNVSVFFAKLCILPANSVLSVWTSSDCVGSC